MTDDKPAERASDPAAKRFFFIQAVRLSGVGSVIIGMLILTHRMPDLPGWVPDWVGYVMIATGLLDIFVVPPFLVRKWRTPQP